MESTVRKTRPVRPVAAKSYTVEEMNDMLDQAEADIAAGRVIDDDDMWLDMDEEYERELAEEQKRQLEIL